MGIEPWLLGLNSVSWHYSGTVCILACSNVVKVQHSDLGCRCYESVKFTQYVCWILRIKFGLKFVVWRNSSRYNYTLANWLNWTGSITWKSKKIVKCSLYMNMIYGNNSQPLVAGSSRWICLFFFRYALELEQRSKIYEIIPFCKCHLTVRKHKSHPSVSKKRTLGLTQVA